MDQKNTKGIVTLFFYFLFIFIFAMLLLLLFFLHYLFILLRLLGPIFSGSLTVIHSTLYT